MGRTTRKGGPQNGKATGRDQGSLLEGIVMADSRWGSEDVRAPRISAFIWGGKVRPTPTLPYGRWKGAA